MPELDEVIRKIKETGIDEDLEAELREAAHPKGARDKIDRLETQVAELKPKAERFDAQQRWPEVETAFKDYKLDDIPAGTRQQLEGFTDLTDVAKVAEFAKTWGLPPKPAGETTTPPPNTASDVVNVATEGSQAPSQAEAEVLARARAAKTPEEQKRILQEAGHQFI